MILHQPATLWPGSSRGPFRIRRMRPGTGLGYDDTGLGPLGTVDRASLSPGFVVPMHEHRDDEILSYLRSGKMHHRDSSGAEQMLDAATFMLMNAGSGFSHEEAVRALSGTTEMLQIFVRPRSEAMEPQLQFHSFDQVYAADWRVIAGPENSDAPLKFRNEVWVHDRRASAGESVGLPRRDGWRLWLHLFHGAGRTGDNLQLASGDSIITDEPSTFAASETSDLVAFLISSSARYSLAGSLSGSA